MLNRVPAVFFFAVLLAAGPASSQSRIELRLREIVVLYYESYGRQPGAEAIDAGVAELSRRLAEDWSITEVEKTAWRILNEAPEAATMPFDELFRIKAAEWGKPVSAEAPASAGATVGESAGGPAVVPVPNPAPAAEPAPAPASAGATAGGPAVAPAPWVVTQPEPTPGPAAAPAPEPIAVPPAFKSWNPETWRWGRERYPSRLVLGGVSTGLLVAMNEGVMPALCAVNLTPNAPLPGSACTRATRGGNVWRVRGYNLSGHLPYATLTTADRNQSGAAALAEIFFTTSLELVLPSFAAQFPSLILATAGGKPRAVQTLGSLSAAAAWWITAAMQFMRYQRYFALPNAVLTAQGQARLGPGALALGGGVAGVVAGTVDLIAGLKQASGRSRAASPSHLALAPWIAPTPDGVALGLETNF